MPELRDGQSWTFGAFVIACAFALGDGSLRLVDAQGALKEVAVHNGACLTLTRHPNVGFITGGDDGRLVRTSNDGSSTEIAKTRGKWIEQIAVAPETGLIAY